MLKLRQKVADIDGKKIAYVETVIDDGKFTYRCNFDEKTKKRYNIYLKNLGFKVGVVAEGENVPDKVMTI